MAYFIGPLRGLRPMRWACPKPDWHLFWVSFFSLWHQHPSGRPDREPRVLPFSPHPRVQLAIRSIRCHFLKSPQTWRWLRACRYHPSEALRRFCDYCSGRFPTSDLAWFLSSCFCFLSFLKKVLCTCASAGFFLLCRLFSSCRHQGLLSCGAWASHCGGFSRCRAPALGGWIPVVVTPGLWSTGSMAVMHGLSCSAACGIFPD